MKKVPFLALGAIMLLNSCDKEVVKDVSEKNVKYDFLMTENYFDRQYDETTQEFTGCSGKTVLDCLVIPVEPQVPQGGGGIPNLNSTDLKDYLQNEFQTSDDFSSERGQQLLSTMLATEIYAEEFDNQEGLRGFHIKEIGTESILYTVLVSE